METEINLDAGITSIYPVDDNSWGSGQSKEASWCQLKNDILQHYLSDRDSRFNNEGIDFGFNP